MEAPESEATVKDAVTGHEVPKRFAPLGKEGVHALVGLGSRSVTFLYITVYSVGFYAKESDLAKFVAATKSTTTADSVLSPAFRDQFFAPGAIERSLRLSPYRTVEMSHLRDGLGRALESRAGAIATNDNREALLNDILKFKQLFPKDKANAGDAIVFLVKGNSIEMEWNGKYIGNMESPFVARYLFEAYVDENSPTPTAKKSIREGLLRAFNLN